jgi:hypothetical protein
MTKDDFINIEGVEEKLQSIADKHGFTVEELLNVIQKESNFDSTAENPKSSATGLIQFMPKTAEGLGTNIEEISNMSAADQLDLVDKYFTQNHTKGQHPYITIAYPKAAKMDMDEVIAKPGDSIATQNPVWQDESGNVTKRSILAYAGFAEDDQTTTTETPVQTTQVPTGSGNILNNIHKELFNNNLTTSDFDTWKNNFFENQEVQGNVYNYLRENGLTDSSPEDWVKNINEDLAVEQPKEPTPVLRDGKEITWEQAINDVDIYSSLTREQKRTLAKQNKGEKTSGIPLFSGSPVSNAILGSEIIDAISDIPNWIKASQGADFTETMFNLAEDSEAFDDEDYSRTLRLMDEQSKKPPSLAMQEYYKTVEEEGGGAFGVVKAFSKNPKIAPEALVTSLAGMIRATGSNKAAKYASLAGFAGLATGGPVRGGQGLFSGLSMAMETTSKFSELLSEEMKGMPGGFTEENLKKIVKDKDRFQKLKNKAYGKGVTVGIIDFATGGLTTAVGKKVLQTTGSKLATVAAGTVVEGVGGGTGEALGSVVIGEDVDAAAVGLEIFAEYGRAPLDIGAALVKPNNYVLNGQKVSFKEMKNFVETADDIDVATADIKIEGDNVLAEKAFGKQNDAILETQVNEKVEDPADRKRMVELEKQRVKAETDVKKKGIQAVPGAKENLENIEMQMNEIVGKYTAIDGRTKDVKARKKVAEQVREGIADKVFSANLEFAKKHSKLYGLEVDDTMTVDQIQKEYGDEAATSDGFITPDNKIIINKAVAKNTGAVNVGNHELLHGVLRKAVKEGKINKNLINDFKEKVGTDNWSKIEQRIKDAGYTEKYMKDTPEEYLTLFSDAIANNDIKFDENIFTKVGDLIKPILRTFGFKKIDFETADGVYDFLKEYNRSIHKGALSSAIVKATEGKVDIEGIKMSKTASDNVQRIYEDQGEAGAFDIIEEFKPITSRIAERRREAPNFDKELLMSEIEIGERGILDLIKEYKPESGVPLAAYINKFLPARAIEASKRVLGEEFTEDVSERVDIAAEEVTPEVKTKPKKKKIVLADRLGVTEEVAKAIKKLMPKIDFNKETFKSLKNQIPEITGEMFGISPKKIISGANITKKELQSAQMFINKNAGVLISMLPEGATAGGTATGVPQTLLKAFYTKTDRAKMAKTGTKAGLAIQVKKPNINKKDFLEVFGIIDGKPDRTDRNTSARVLALANQTGKMMTNQAVRQSLISDGKTVGEITSLSDGKAKIMFSKTGKKKVTSPVKSASQKTADKIGKKATYDNMVKAAGLDIDTGGLKLKPIDLTTEEGRQEYIGFIAEVLAPIFPKKVLLAMSGSFARGDSAIEKANKNKFLFQNKEQFEIFLETLEATGVVFGENMTVENQNDILNAIKREGYGKATSKTQGKKMKDKELKASKKRGFRLIWETIQNNIQEDQRTIPGFALMLSSSSRFQGHFTRTGAVIDFVNTLTGKNREEHTSPITALGKYLFLHAIIGDLFTGGKNSVFENATKSYFQGSLPVFMDNRLKLKGVYDYSSLPPIEHLEGILKGDISIWARYFHPNVNNNFTTDFDSMSVQDIANGEHLIGGINPNVIELANGNTIAQEFGVDVNVKITPQIVTAQQDLIYRIAIGEKISDSKIKSVLNTAINLKIKPQLKETKTLNKSIAFSRSANNKTKGITVLDFDDTLATTKSLVRFTAPDGTKGALNAEQYAAQYQDLLEQGYTFDFTEFDKVVKGKIAPLFQKALKLQKKFGPENMFVLTARPPAAQKPIFDFLKANGLNIPIKNITGLGNSTSEAKALWIADKVGEGYNDFYFADDALQNVQAVKNMLEQFDVKSKVQQAKVKFSKTMNKDFNDILEDVTSIESKKRFSAIKARKRGASKGKFRFFIPPSHEDFVGLLYNFIGKGKEGNKHRDFFEQALIRPLNRAYRELNAAKQSIANDYKSLNKQFKDVKKKLIKKTPDGDFTYQDAVRVYLWDKHGYDIPGLSEADQKSLVDLVVNDSELQTYAETLNIISKQDTYIAPTESWEAGDIRTDLDDATGRIGRGEFFTEFNENVETIFSQENLNKIEAAYGASVVSAIKDMLYRIKTGQNRPSGQNKQTNQWLNYLNGSVAATMFFNIRSAVLQQMSLVNFINYADNNILASAKAFANQKQYWSDWAKIFNSDFMKQRRKGIKTDVNGAELAASVKGAKNPAQTAIKKLLELGFLPTQIGDNIAIATGGATFLRNRINTYLKQGLSKKEAESKAFVDFQVLAEATQQSARPDMVSQQQASPLGKVILAFQNVTSQFNRLGKKAFLDIKNRRITPGNTTQLQSDMSNLSRIAYYFAIQNIIFYTLQSALFMAMFDDDEDDKRMLAKKERVINGTLDSVLRGTGVWGAAVSTLKNMAFAYHKERAKDWNGDEASVLVEGLNVSPPLGIKARKIVNAERTLNYNRKTIDEMETFDMDNPQWSANTSYIEAITNVPLNRLYNKTQNIRESLNNQHDAMQRVLLFSGWSKWNLGIEDITKEKKKQKFGRGKTRGKTRGTTR